MIGLKKFNTETILYNKNGYDDPNTLTDEREIAASTNANDTAFSCGYGVGIDVLLTKPFNKNTHQKTSSLFFF